MSTFGSSAPRKLGSSASVPTFPKSVGGTYADSTGGVIVPGGALDRWYAYRPSLGAARRSVIAIGDSTTFGSNDDGSHQHYSWLQRVRDRAVAAGFADGGKGMFGNGEFNIVYDSPEINGFASGIFPGSADGFDNLAGQDYFSSTAADTVTLQFRTTDLRIWYVNRSGAGSFTYSIDGGTAVRVDAHGSTSGIYDQFVYISGLAANTTHTVTFVNMGGRPAAPPTTCTASEGAFGSGTIASGTTYYYKVTYTFSGGETLPGPTATITTTQPTVSVNVQVPDVGQSSATLYRSTSSGGTFGIMTGVTPTVGGGVLRFSDTGSVTPGATNPPTTGTTNLNTTARIASVAVAPVNATGLSVQKHGTNGATVVNFFHGGLTDYTGTHDASRYQSALGLVPTARGLGSPTSADGYVAGNTVDTSYPSAQRVAPILAVMHLGFNDLTGQANTDYTNYVEGVKKFAAACNAAGCDAVVASGQLPRNANWTTYGMGVYAALRDTAIAHGCAFIDLYTPINGVATGHSTQDAGSPHLTKAQYQAQGDFLWDAMLSLT